MNFYNFIKGNIEGIYFPRQYLLSLFLKYPCKKVKISIFTNFSTKTYKNKNNNNYYSFKT
jgi:hypothetical protein